MKNRQYHGVQLSKKESELIEFLQTGSDDFWKAFYVYKHRSKGKSVKDDLRKEQSWFNKTLRSLKDKGLCENIPFVIHHSLWRNPGLKASKAEFKAITLQEQKQEFFERQKQIIVS